MAYQTGTPASLTDLMDTFKAFALGNGGFADSGSGYSASSYTYFALNRGGVHYGFSYKDASGGGDCLFNTSTAWAGSGLLTAQTGACGKNARAFFGLTPIQYWMFSDGDATHMVAEISSGCYAHLSVGVIEKYGTYTGGAFVSANYWNNATIGSSGNSRHLDGYTVSSSNTYINHVRVTYDSKTIAGFGSNSHSGLNHVRNLWMSGGIYNSFSDGELIAMQPNSYNGRSVLIPVELFLAYDLASSTDPTGWIPLGRLNNCALVNIANLSAEEIVNTDWMVFPLSMKNPTGSLTLASGMVDTDNYGFAYKQ
jgi:hypothetical protein